MTPHPRHTSWPTDISPQGASFFIDFDGTLVAIAARPDLVSVRPDILAALARIHQATGRVAIISGRPLDQLDAHLGTLGLPLAGTHGSQYRNPDGTIHAAAFDPAVLRRLVDALRDFAAPHEGLLVEPKPGSVALHYRARPELGPAVLEAARSLEAAHRDVSLLHGKMVAELRLGGRSKADAVSHFMALDPFRGHMPVFIGDDVTDEDGIRRAQELGGIGIKVGPDETVADRRFDDIEAFWHWLIALAATMPPMGKTGTDVNEPGRVAP